MKANRNFSLFVFFASLIIIMIVGCEKDVPEPVDPNPPATLTFNVNINNNIDTVTKGGMILVGITSNADSGIIVLGGIERKIKNVTNGTEQHIITENTQITVLLSKGEVKNQPVADKMIYAEEVVPAKTTSVDLSVIPGTITKFRAGDYITFVVHAKNALMFESNIPGISGDVNDTVSDQIYLTVTTTFEVTAIGTNGNAHASKIIEVEIPTPLLDIFTDSTHAWSPNDGRIRCSENDPWGDLIISSDEKTLKYVLQRNGKYKLYHGNVFKFEANFTINESDSTLDIGYVFKIKRAEDGEIWLFHMEACNCPPGNADAFVERSWVSSTNP